jgi:hypothetical protein
MNIRSRSVALFAAALCLGAPPLLADDTDPQIASCIGAVGTYLTRHAVKADDGGDAVMRSLLSLTNGGHAFFTDSAEAGVPGYQPFSDGRGAWRCDADADGTMRFTALILDFTFPDAADTDARIARLDIAADISAQTISGTTRLGFVPLGGDPFDRAALTDAVEYAFTGVKVTMDD